MLSLVAAASTIRSTRADCDPEVITVRTDHVFEAIVLSRHAPSEVRRLVEDLFQTHHPHAKAYSEAKRITCAAWREVGVAPATLKAAGITRGAS